MVERNLAKVDVAGSSPVSRSGISDFVKSVGFSPPIPRRGTRNTAFFFNGDVPKWLRERSAKPLCGGSNPPVASLETVSRDSWPACSHARSRAESESGTQFTVTDIVTRTRRGYVSCNKPHPLAPQT